MTEPPIVVHLVHPVERGTVLRTAVSPDTTPRTLVEQMIQARLLPPARRIAQYRLRNTRSGVQLLDDVSLRDAGIPDGVTLAVDDSLAEAS